MNDDTAFAGLGPCAEFEFELADLVDGALATERLAPVRSHLDGCGRCRAFVQQLRELDRSLAAAVPRVQLAPDFDARLRERVASVTRRVPKDTARAQAENEYVAALRGLRDGLRWRTALNAIAGAAVGGGLLLGIDRLVETLAPTLMQVSAPTSLLAPTYASAWSFGIAGIAVAGGAIASRVLRRTRS